MADITTRLPSPLSERLSGTSSVLLQRNGKEVDVALGGVPFLLATSSDLPQTVETIPQRKEQLDVESEPGEQSLQTWWRRSQESFHEGAGNLFQENRNENVPSAGFYDSRGVDIWTPGELKLIRKMNRVDSLTGFTKLKTYAMGGTRTNLSTNPSCETDITGYVGGGNGEPAPLLARDSTRADSGSWALKVTWQGDDGAGFPPSIQFPHATLTVGVTYTVTCRVWVSSGAPDVGVVAAGDFGTKTSTKGQWVTLSRTFNCNDPAQWVGIWTTTIATSGTTMWVDSVLIEESASSQPYFDGNSTGGAWSGTANNSTSTQTVAETATGLSGVKGGALYSGDTPANLAALHAPAGKTLVDGFVSGSYFYDLATDGTLYQGLVSSPGTATSWPCGADGTRMTFGKHRLWIAGGRKLWQPDLSLASGSTQSPIFTHPNQGWTYTCIAEGPQAMYFGGHDGRTSSIQAVALDTGGGVPTLTGAQVTAILPDGELIQEIAVLAGQYIGIGTNRGFRVGVIDGVNITYGPILFAPEGVNRCTSIATQDRFFLVGFATEAQPAELWRVDTGTPLQDGIFPYARDIECGDGSVTSIAAVDNQTVVVTDTLGWVWEQSATELVEQGYLHTGRIRFRTQEKKLFKYVELDTEPLYGSIVIDGYTDNGSEFDVATYDDNTHSAGGTPPIALTSTIGPQRHIALKLTLVRDASLTDSGPIIRSYLVRALPSSKPQRMITLPLLCYDQEQGHSGMRYGYEGYASDRLSALQALEDLGDTLIYQNYGLLDRTGQSVVIDNMRFVQNAPGHSREKSSGRGGILIVQLRTVTA